MHLAAFVYPTGYHTAAWRLEDVPADMGINFPVIRSIAHMAEAAKFDFLFFADSLAVRGTDWPVIAKGALRYVSQFEPLTLLSALAVETSRIGLVSSASTTFWEPYHLARLMASIDHISNGRAGWNLVTSQNSQEAGNFGVAPLMEHGRRYLRAREFADVVRRLWDSWSDRAFVRDKNRGLFFDTAEMQKASYHGEFFDVEGPLNLPRTRQGHPVIVQSGASEAGKNLAAECAEVVFTAQTGIAEARSFYSDIKRRVAEKGRDPLQVKIMPGMFVYAAATRSEAEDDRARLDKLIDSEVAMSMASTQLSGVDLSSYDLGKPLPDIPETNAGRSRRALLIEYARENNLTLGELITYIAASRGHHVVVGSGREVADELCEWCDTGAADGFNIMAPYLPGGLEKFCKTVVPDLQRRGVFRKEYQGEMLRDHLGLPVPSRRSPI